MRNNPVVLTLIGLVLTISVYFKPTGGVERIVWDPSKIWPIIAVFSKDDKKPPNNLLK